MVSYCAGLVDVAKDRVMDVSVSEKMGSQHSTYWLAL